MSFQCVIVAPEQQLLDESVNQVILPAEDGLLGVLTGRAPLLARLGLGELRIDLADGQKRQFLVEGGVAQMKDNKLTILTNAAWAATDLNAQAAQAEYDAAAASPVPTPKPPTSAPAGCAERNSSNRWRPQSSAMSAERCYRSFPALSRALVSGPCNSNSI